MRNITTIILICILSFPAFGQETDNPHKDKTSKSIYLELLGASNMIGVSYDTRIKPGSAFGYRAGISYFYGTDYNSNEGHGFSVPLEFNCILSKRRSKFEAGTGINMGLYSIKETYWVNSEGNVSIIEPVTQIVESRNTFGYYIFLNIGYRYQRESGFMFRAGISPSFNFGDKYGLRKTPLLYPYLSFGYTFK